MRAARVGRIRMREGKPESSRRTPIDPNSGRPRSFSKDFTMELRSFTICILLSLGLSSAFPQNALVLAKHALQKRDTVRALSLLEEAMQERSSAADAATLMAHIAMAQGHPQDALAGLDALLKRDKENAGATRLRGDVHWALCDTQAAIADYRAASALAPHSAGILLAYGRTLLAADSVDRAMVVLLTAKVYGPKDAAIYESLGDAFCRLPLPPTAIKNYEESLRLQPKNVAVHMKLAQVYLDQRRYTEAVRAFAAVHTIDSSLAEAYLEEGKIYVRAKLYARAVGPLRKYMRLRPDDAVGDTLLIAALSGAGDHAAAARRAHQLLGKDSSSVAVWRMYVGALVASKRYSDVPAAIASLGRRAPLTGADYANLGNAYFDAGKDDESLSAYREAVRIDSTLPEPYNRLGMLLMKRKEYARAAEMFERHIGIGGRHLSAYLNGGACHLALVPGSANRDSLLHHARTLLVSALEANPRSLAIRFRLAQYYVLADSFDLAQAQYREVLDIAGREPGKHRREIGEAWSQIAFGYSVKKEYAEAVRAFSRAAAAGYENAGLYLQWGLAVMQTVSQNSSAQENREIIAESERLFRKCINLDARNSQGHFWLGEALIRLRIEGENALIRKLTGEACREFARALALDPSLEDAKKEMVRYGCR
jgi:tetratricopeptide (TPR) repeat protein